MAQSPLPGMARRGAARRAMAMLSRPELVPLSMPATDSRRLSWYAGVPPPSFGRSSWFFSCIAPCSHTSQVVGGGARGVCAQQGRGGGAGIEARGAGGVLWERTVQGA